MLDIKKVIFSDEQLLTGGIFLLVEMIPALDDATNERVGTDIVVALTGQRYEQITVRVPYPVTCSAFDSVSVQQVEFTDFRGHFEWQESQDEWVFVATAEQFQVVDEVQ